MGIDSHDHCYCKAILCNDKLQNDIWLSAASMLECDFAPESKITKHLEHEKTASGQQTFNCEN